MKRVLLSVSLFMLLWAGLTFGIRAATPGNTLGGDFYIYWNAGRAALFERADPYSDEVAQQVQQALLMRLALPGEDQLGFAYPPYALLPMLPLLPLPFDWAQAAWMAFLCLAFLSACLAAARRAPRWTAPTFLLFYPSFLGLIEGNFVLLISAGLLLQFPLLEHKHPNRKMQVGLGLLAAWCAVKPQFSWLYLALLGVVAVRRRWWGYLLAALGGLAGMLAFSYWLVPGWPALWLERLGKYAVYNQARPLLTDLLSLALPEATSTWLSAFLALALLAATVLLALRWLRGALSVPVLLGWTALVTALLHPRSVAYEQLVFLLPLLLWAGAQKSSRPALHLWWWGSLAVSWLGFWLTSRNGLGSLAGELPLLLHAAWVGWLLWAERPGARQLPIENQPIT